MGTEFQTLSFWLFVTAAFLALIGGLAFLVLSTTVIFDLTAKGIMVLVVCSFLAATAVAGGIYLRRHGM